MKRCAQCDGKKASGIHLSVHPQYHAFQDGSQAGISPIGKDREAYLRQSKYRARSKDAQTKPCGFFAAGAPEPPRMFGECNGDAEGVHHTMPRSRAGGLEAAERYPKVPACNAHNTAATQDADLMAWATTHTFYDEESGRDVPFLLSMKMRRTG